MVAFLSMPPLQIGILLVVVPIIIRDHSTSVSFVGAVLLVISLLVDGLDFLILRARRRQHVAH